MIIKKRHGLQDRDTDIQSDVNTETQRYKLIAMLDPHTGNNTKTIFLKGPRLTSQMDGRIILTLRGFDPVACGRMCCTQLWEMFYDYQKAMWMTRHRNGEIEAQTDRNIIWTGTHWGPPDSSVGITKSTYEFNGSFVLLKM